MKADLVRRFPLFATLTDEEFNQIEHIFVKKNYRRNQVIFVEEDTGNYMYLVVTGKVKVVKAAGAGKETLLAIHRAGDFFGEMSLLDGKTAPATVVAMEDSTIISISRANFHKYLMHNEKILMQVVQVLCARLRQVWLTQSLSSSSAHERICMTIYQLARRHGIPDPRGTLIDLKITHQELAEMAGTSRETVTRVLTGLRKQGIIKIDQRRLIVVNLQSLLPSAEQQ